MPVTSGQVTVGTAATVIDTTDVMPWRLQINNDDNTDTVFIGGATVGTATGMQVQKLEHQSFEMSPGDRMYAVSSKAGHKISFLKITRDR